MTLNYALQRGPAGAGPSEACEWHFRDNLGSQNKHGLHLPCPQKSLHNSLEILVVQSES
jgi:hypothetical protein